MIKFGQIKITKNKNYCFLVIHEVDEENKLVKKTHTIDIFYSDGEVYVSSESLFPNDRNLDPKFDKYDQDDIIDIIDTAVCMLTGKKSKHTSH